MMNLLCILLNQVVISQLISTSLGGEIGVVSLYFFLLGLYKLNLQDFVMVGINCGKGS